MSLAPSSPVVTQDRQKPYHLAKFDARTALLVATWARDEHELFWLAPKTAAPLTAAKVLAWPGEHGRPMLLCREGGDEPLGYLELNTMPGETRHLWMGHCLIRPDHRGRGLGRIMVDLMLDKAFIEQEAERVSLVAFPDNTPAVFCYRAAGFVDAGEQIKFFYTTGRRHRMRHMSIDRARFASIRSPSDPR